MSKNYSGLRALSTPVRIVAVCAFAMVATSCGSKKEPSESDAKPVATSNAAPGTAAGTSAGTDDVSQWFEPEAESSMPDYASAESIADPEAAIERYKSECGGDATSAECRALRSDVEAIFLDSLLAVRASREKVDPRWYRLAAASQSPQLACIGLTELIWDPKRTPQDETLIAQALDSPYQAVRGAVYLNAGRLRDAAGFPELMKRAGRFDYRELSGVCLDQGRDPVPSPKWAGKYPGVQFRAFASDESRRWFTTPDAPEKVIAWFEAQGKVARTQQQLMEDGQARYMEEMTKLSADSNVDNTDKMMALITGQGSQAQWGQAFQNMEGIGEVKYVMIGANQAIAIFRDDLLKATSIVATEPLEPVNLHPDMEAEMKRAKMRAIFGY
jgi:hypothetical protein